MEKSEVPQAILDAEQTIAEWMVDNQDLGPRVYLPRKGPFRFYDDTSGQRSAYLEFHSYGPDRRRRGGKAAILRPKYRSFIVRRKLSFQNRNDFGKDGAVLCTVNLRAFENVDVMDNGTLFVFDGIFRISLKSTINITNINKLDNAYEDHPAYFKLENPRDFYQRIFKKKEL